MLRMYSKNDTKAIAGENCESAQWIFTCLHTFFFINSLELFTCLRCLTYIYLSVSFYWCSPTEILFYVFEIKHTNNLCVHKTKRHDFLQQINFFSKSVTRYCWFLIITLLGTHHPFEWQEIYNIVIYQTKLAFQFSNVFVLEAVRQL